jgi:hypothetical protein
LWRYWLSTQTLITVRRIRRRRATESVAVLAFSAKILIIK